MRASEAHFFLHDANFNVTAAVDDSDNSVVERYGYAPLWTRLRRLGRLAQRLQSGRLDAYLAYMLIAVVAAMSVVTFWY